MKLMFPDFFDTTHHVDILNLFFFAYKQGSNFLKKIRQKLKSLTPHTTVGRKTFARLNVNVCFLFLARTVPEVRKMKKSLSTFVTERKNKVFKIQDLLIKKFNYFINSGIFCLVLKCTLH